jgi:hypothetical protein
MLNLSELSLALTLVQTWCSLLALAIALWDRR